MAISSPIAAQRKGLSVRANECESRNLRISSTFAVNSVPGSLDSLLAMTWLLTFCVDFYGFVNERGWDDVGIVPYGGMRISMALYESDCPTSSTLAYARPPSPKGKAFGVRCTIRGSATPVLWHWFAMTYRFERSPHQCALLLATTYFYILRQF